MKWSMVTADSGITWTVWKRRQKSSEQPNGHPDRCFKFDQVAGQVERCHSVRTWVLKTEDPQSCGLSLELSFKTTPKKVPTKRRHPFPGSFPSKLPQKRCPRKEDTRFQGAFLQNYPKKGAHEKKTPVSRELSFKTTPKKVPTKRRHPFPGSFPSKLPQKRCPRKEDTRFQGFFILGWLVLGLCLNPVKRHILSKRWQACLITLVASFVEKTT